MILAVGVNSDGRREVMGMDVGASEAETFWTGFLRKLTLRGLHGVKLATSDAHVGIKASVAKVMHATSQRRRAVLTRKSKGYFAEPFSSWQRGANENFNGLVRQYIPKKRPLSLVTDTELAINEDLLNNRTRKRLRFKTPLELFSQSLNCVALRT